MFSNNSTIFPEFEVVFLKSPQRFGSHIHGNHPNKNPGDRRAGTFTYSIRHLPAKGTCGGYRCFFRSFLHRRV